MLQRLAIFALTFGASFCVHAAGVGIADVQKMEALWHSKAITSYSFTPGLHSSGARRDPRVRVTVVNSRVKEIRFITRFGKHRAGTRISAADLKMLAPLPLTIEEAFLEVKECIASRSPLESVDFHKELGAPLYWTCGEIAEDGWWGAELNDLETGTPPNKYMQRAGRNEVLGRGRSSLQPYQVPRARVLIRWRTAADVDR
jgi:hypothetical protein